MHDRHAEALLGDGDLIKALKARVDLKLIQEEEFEVAGSTSRYYIMKRVAPQKLIKTWDDKFGDMNKFKHGEVEGGAS